MTLNLPEHIREHFQEQNKRHLEKDLELCPVYRIGLEDKIIVHDFTAYGLESNSCFECEGKDKTCEIYNDWYSKRHLRGKKC